MSQKKEPVVGGLLLLGASLIWGFAFIPTRYLGTSGFGVFFEMLCRFSGPVILLTPFFYKTIFSTPKECIINSILAGLVLFTGIVLTVLGLRMVAYGTVGVFLLSIYTIIVPLYFGLIQRQKLSLLVKGSVILAAIGALLLAWGNPGAPPNLGTLFCVLAAFCYAAYIIFCAYRAQDVSPQSFQFYQCLGILTIAIPLYFIFEHQSPPASTVWSNNNLWGAIIFLAAAGGTVAYQLFFYGQIKAEPTAAAIILSMQSVFGALIEAVFFGLRMTSIAWIGCGMIFAATLLVSWPQTKKA
ncbi:MAG: DMT family transporter [Brevinema sp.]